MSEKMTLSSALSVYFSQAESSREGWRDADDETWEEAEQLINKHRKDIFNSLKLQELVKEGIKNADPCGMLDGCYELDFYKSLLEDSEKKT